ncbi:MAG: arginine repressor [Clostridia bacterium]|nr:arginine repressor [Clostridia bacterium]
MKKGRQEKILELITKYEIETQDELIEFLGEEGYNVTQATISRDIRDLDLVKVAMPDGAYKYVVSHVSKKGAKNTGLLSHTVMDTVLSITCAQNIIVLRTTAGMAQAVALAIDRIPDSDILGSVAGDDTIIVVTADSATAETVAAKMRKLLSIG